MNINSFVDTWINSRIDSMKRHVAQDSSTHKTFQTENMKERDYLGVLG